MCLPLISPVTLCVPTWLVGSSLALKKFLHYEDILFILLCPKPIFLVFWVNVQSRHLKNISLLENLSKCFSASFFFCYILYLARQRVFSLVPIQFVFGVYMCMGCIHLYIYASAYVWTSVNIYVYRMSVRIHGVPVCAGICKCVPPRVHVALWECVVCIHVCLLIVLPWRQEAWTTQKG